MESKYIQLVRRRIMHTYKYNAHLLDIWPLLFLEFMKVSVAI